MEDVVRFTAGLFDELLLDDFFLTTTKADSDIRAKGTKSWSEFRLALMTEAARTLVIEPARAVNPTIKVVIKYRNWYEHFPHAGFNLEAEPRMFDAIYTGTETRDPVHTHQHLQEYQSYSIMRVPRERQARWQRRRLGGPVLARHARPLQRADRAHAARAGATSRCSAFRTWCLPSGSPTARSWPRAAWRPWPGTRWRTPTRCSRGSAPPVGVSACSSTARQARTTCTPSWA